MYKLYIEKRIRVGIIKVTKWRTFFFEHKILNFYMSNMDAAPPPPPEQDLHTRTRMELKEKQRKEVYCRLLEISINGRLPNVVFGLVAEEVNRSSGWKLRDRANVCRHA
jgi:hypothetical protein